MCALALTQSRTTCINPWVQSFSRKKQNMNSQEFNIGHSRIITVVEFSPISLFADVCVLFNFRDLLVLWLVNYECDLEQLNKQIVYCSA